MPEKLHGVNLSGWLIAEPWVSPSLFEATGASCELELVRHLGLEAYTTRMDRHYKTFITQFDFSRIAELGFNSVRLPVPWHVFGAKSVAGNLPSLIEYVDKAFEWAALYDLKILLDLATVPGGQGDANSHPSGLSTAPEFHLSSEARTIALQVLEGLARRYGKSEQLLGIELLDSPAAHYRRGLKVDEGIPLHFLRNFYRDAYALIHQYMDDEKLTVFSASGHPRSWKHFMKSSEYKNVWMDLHLYHYLGDLALDISTPKGLSAALNYNRKMIAAARSAGFPVIVGEWSAAAVLPDSVMTPEGRVAYERVFASSQLSTFDECEGWFFQTYKTERRIPAWDARATFSSFERGMFD